MQLQSINPKAVDLQGIPNSPAKGQVLSRERFYTALTRQEDKIIILHQGPFGDFLKYASPLASSTSAVSPIFSFPQLSKKSKINITIQSTSMSRNEVKE